MHIYYLKQYLNSEKTMRVTHCHQHILWSLLCSKYNRNGILSLDKSHKRQVYFPWYLDKECLSSNCWKISFKVRQQQKKQPAIIYILFDYWRSVIVKFACMTTFLIKKQDQHEATFCFWIFWIFHGEHSVNYETIMFLNIVNQLKKLNVQHGT